MDTTVKSPVLIYTEQTPNPESLKFVTNRMIYQGTADFKDLEFAKEWSPLATALFEFPYVKGVYVCNNFVTINKEFNYEWGDIMMKLKEFIKGYVADEKPPINEGFAEAMEKIEAERALELLNKASIPQNFIGIVAPAPTEDKTYLSHLSNLKEIVQIYQVNELIFCSKDISAQSIMHWMTELGNKMDYKIVPKETMSIIGSNSKNTPGELYTVDIQFNIASPMNRRNKRVFDVGISLAILPLLPLLFFVIKDGFSFLKNWLSVLLGTKTWVGYHSDFQNENLPKLKAGILNPTHNLKIKIEDEATIRRLNFLYARDYEPERDFEVFRKGFKFLGNYVYQSFED